MVSLNKEADLIALYFTIFAMIASLFTIPFGGWYWWPLSLFDFGMLALVGISGGIGNLALTQAYKNADIIHIHWLSDGFINLKSISKISKPIVWTMRDMWPFTGGSHYTMEFEKYEKG